MWSAAFSCRPSRRSGSQMWTLAFTAKTGSRPTAYEATCVAAIDEASGGAKASAKPYADVEMTAEMDEGLR